MDELEPHPFAAGLVYGEGLRWYGGRLWLSDVLGRTVYAYSATGERQVIAHVSARPSGLGFLPDGRLLIASMADRRLLLRERDGGLAEYARLDHLMTGDCGDLTVDKSGRVYLGDLGYRAFDGEERHPGRLLRADPDGTAHVLVDNLAVPAGLGVTENGSRLIVAEGRAATLHCFDLTAAGDLTEQRVFARLPNTVLGGLALDAAGAMWQCCPEDRAVLRMLYGGTITHIVRLPLQPTACCLGGPDFRALYVVAAADTGERMVKETCRAELFTVGVGTPGFPLPGDR